MKTTYNKTQPKVKVLLQQSFLIFKWLACRLGSLKNENELLFIEPLLLAQESGRHYLHITNFHIDLILLSLFIDEETEDQVREVVSDPIT